MYPFLQKEKCQGGRDTGYERLESESKKVINDAMGKEELVQGQGGKKRKK